MKATIIVDLGFGDAGKGRITDLLANPGSLVVRYNGGAQAAHNVIHNGRHHTFSQFGSGTFRGAATFLSEYMLVEPLGFILEASALRDYDVLRKTTVHPQCKITTPWHALANQAKERNRRAERHGSCGIGIGETVNAANHGYSLTVEDVKYGTIKHITDKCTALRHFLLDQTPHNYLDFSYSYTWHEWQVSDFVHALASFRDAVNVHPEPDLNRYDNVIFEGAQGILIDEKYGAAPYHTWSNCTTGNAEKLCAEWGLEPYRLGVTRTYMVRHGAGPLPSEVRTMSFKEHNMGSMWQGAPRYGHMDLGLIKYAVACNGGVDGLAVTWLDAPPDVIRTQWHKDGHRAFVKATIGEAVLAPNVSAALHRISDAAQAGIILTSRSPGA